MSVSKKAVYELAGRLLQMDFFNDREKDILKMRLGLDGNAPGTLEEIGQKYSITRERVRQIGAAIIRKVKKHLPEEKNVVSNLFLKAWEPKYVVKERRVMHKRAAIKRNRTIIRNKSKKLSVLIDEFAATRTGKENINSLFKELRIKYRKNKSLFEPDVVIEIKSLRQKYSVLKKFKPQLDKGPSPIEPTELKPPEQNLNA